MINKQTTKNAYHQAKQSWLDIKEIVNPLKHYGIIDFEYSKFKNGSRIVELVTDITYIDELVAQLDEFSTGDFLENCISKIKPGLNIYPYDFDPANIKNNKIIEIITNKTNRNGVTFVIAISSYDKQYLETFDFIFPSKDPEIWTKKLNLVNELINFAYYFKDSAKKIIEIGQQKNERRLQVTNKNDAIMPLPNNAKSLVIPKKFYFEFLPTDKHLTLQEVKILKAHYNGFSSKEIAKILQLSPRTVDNHLSNIRHKCHTDNLIGLINQSMVARECLLNITE